MRYERKEEEEEEVKSGLHVSCKCDWLISRKHTKSYENENMVNINPNIIDVAKY
jgi:hypothetical protein